LTAVTQHSRAATKEILTAKNAKTPSFILPRKNAGEERGGGASDIERRTSNKFISRKAAKDAKAADDRNSDLPAI
jgi:hypothetical protein